MEDRLLGALRSLVPRAAPMANNISLPSPLAQNHPPPPQTTEGVSPAAKEDTAALTLPQAPPPLLPEKVKQKIFRGEYIDFDTLLLYPARHGLGPSPSFTLRLSSDTDHRAAQTFGKTLDPGPLFLDRGVELLRPGGR